MPGRVVDLSVPDAQFPDPIVVDTNLIVERLLVPLLGSPRQQTAVNATRAARFFHELNLNNGTGIVTPTIFKEFVHAAIRFKYRQEQLNMRAAGQQPPGLWQELYKQDATILQGFASDLEQLRQLISANGLLFLPPEQLGPIASGRSHDEELVHLAGRYGLDSNDASILLEALRYGYTDLITLDTDMQRAQSDFTIYTWN